MQKNRGFAQYAALAVVGVLAIGAAIISSAVTRQTQGSRVNGAVLAEATTEFSVQTPTSIANQDGTTVVVGAQKAWIGTAQSTTQSYLGMVFSGGSVPAGATIKSATVDFVAVGNWITVGTTFYGDKSNSTGFSSGVKLSSLPLTTSSNTYSDNVNWPANSTQSYDVTSVVSELFTSGSAPRNSFVLIAKGKGSAYARKEVYGAPSTGKAARLRVVYQTASATATPVTTPVVTATATATATATTVATATPVVTVPPAPPATPPATMTMSMSPVPTATTGTTSTIYGVVSADLLGTCSAAVHDRYVTTGPDGKTYRTWHPTTVPVDPANPNGTKCTFAHEHGDDPSTSNIFRGAVPFDYIPAQVAMDEPHAGFKCFVHNKGTRNDEGGVALHDSYYCFHMGTGGPARFSTRFHSMDFHVVTSTGVRMDVQGLADVGNVGTICTDPREQRTVMGYGCKLDSAYEIWENRLNIVNKGNTVASATTSTAVFDPITVMDPADKTKLVYTWDPTAIANIFKFNDNRSSYRGCDREAYSGPLNWYNSTGVQTYYTDVYGNVVDGGALKQTISNVNTKSAGSLTQFGGLIMAYKGGTEPMVQFKYRKSACVPGLGLKN